MGFSQFADFSFSFFCFGILNIEGYIYSKYTRQLCTLKINKYNTACEIIQTKNICCQPLKSYCPKWKFKYNLEKKLS